MLDLPENAPKPGEVFAEQYRVERVIGVGGMGVVFAATRLAGNERVAIKVLLTAAAKNQVTVRRFLREGRAVGSLKSQHVARMIEVAELPDKTPYIVMEHLEGADLADILNVRGKVGHVQAVDWVLQACDAIAEAHAARIIHRDLKPSNLFLAQTGDTERVKVLDFGISKMSDAEPANLTMTKTASVLGSPLYMSPEQLKSSRTVDERADIWALGVILFELISGRPPFIAETLAELGALVLSGDAPWLGDTAPDLPPGFAEVVATCLRKNADDRFRNLADFADAIAPFGSDSARISASKVIGTLGMPEKRASVARESRSAASLALAATIPHSDSEILVRASLPSFPGGSGPYAAVVPNSTPNPLSSSGGGLALSQSTAHSNAWLAIGAVIALAAVLGVSVFAWTSFHHPDAGPSATAAPSSSIASPLLPPDREREVTSAQVVAPPPSPPAIASATVGKVVAVANPPKTTTPKRPPPVSSAPLPTAPKPETGVARGAKD